MSVNREVLSVYKPGDKIVYGIHGVCEILEVVTRIIDRRKRDFYVLQPIGQTADRFFVPTDNAAALAKMHTLLSRDDIENLFNMNVDLDGIWISDDNQRKQRYRELISSGDRKVLVYLIKVLHIHRAKQQAQGRKFHISDENFLRDALKLLSSEISYVLNISQPEATEYLKGKLLD